MHHSQFDFIEAFSIYPTESTLNHQYYSTTSTLTHQYKVVKCLALIIYLEQMYSGLIMMNPLELHLELDIETQLVLLEEIIWVLQLAPLMDLDCWMGNRLGGVLAQNHQRTCCTWSKAVLSLTFPNHNICLIMHHS